MNIFSIFGWFGTALILIAYLQSARGIWPAHQRTSASINLIGALLLGASAWYYNALPNVALEAIFAVIAILTLRKSFK